MTVPLQTVCTPWATEADLCSPCDEAGYLWPADLLDDSLETASNILFHLTGRQYPGSCCETVRPCNQGVPLYPTPDRTATSWALSSVCACTRPDTCSCSGISQIRLPGYPLTSIDEILLANDTNPDWPGSAVLDPARYRIDDWRWLVRLNNPDGTKQTWPCCSDLLAAAGEEDTFQVTYTYGIAPPPSGVHAAAVLGCELALACSPETVGDCQLSHRVQTIVRQGVTMVFDRLDSIRDGFTSIPAVDLFLRSVNPGRVRSRLVAASLSSRRLARRVGT